MTEHQRESDQVAQRRANFEALVEARRRAVPAVRSSGRTPSTALVDAYGQRTGDELTAERIETRTAGRILAIRSFGKANFLVISDGVSKIQVYRPAGLAERARLRDLQAARLRRLRRRGRAPVPHQDQRADDPRRVARVPRQVLPAAAREVARLERHRNPLSPALSRPDRQSRLAARVRGAEPGAGGHPGFSERPRLSRGRDADDAADCRRRARAAVRHAPQRARHAAVPPHRAGALPEASDRRRHRTRLRDQP